jgi:hypothetical protein
MTDDIVPELRAFLYKKYINSYFIIEQKQKYYKELFDFNFKNKKVFFFFKYLKYMLIIESIV